MDTVVGTLVGERRSLRIEGHAVGGMPWVQPASLDEDGRISFHFDDNELKKVFVGRPAKLFFKVFEGDTLLTSTEGSVEWTEGDRAPAEVHVGPDAYRGKKLPLEISVVAGRVLNRFGEPAVPRTGKKRAFWVDAYDQDLEHVDRPAPMRPGQHLGSAPVDDLGRYEIPYRKTAYRLADKGSADLVVVVRASESAREEIVRSKTYFNAGRVDTVDFTLQGSLVRFKSEYERLMASLAPVLRGVSHPGELSDAQVDFLLNETRENEAHIRALRHAYRQHSAGGELTELFYGLARVEFAIELAPLCVFRGNAIADSAARRSPIPMQGDR